MSRRTTTDKNNIKNHRARKRFGQNFLCDDQVIAHIINAIYPNDTDNLVEIGPGLGALTQPILQRIGHLTAIELDRDLIPKLHEQLDHLGTLTLFSADALTFNFSSLVVDNQKIRVLGNLPYNVATPILFHLLEQIACITDMHFMMQKEVAERIVAQPGSKAYGRLSIMVQYFCQAIYLFTIEPKAFIPRPKVESAFLRLIPHSLIAAPVNDLGTFERLVKQAFSQRRKTLKNNLIPLISAEELIKLNINPADRPEQISIEDYVRISNYLYPIPHKL